MKREEKELELRGHTLRKFEILTHIELHSQAEYLIMS